MPSAKITSLTNPHVKRIIKLRDRTERHQTNATIIEGAREFLCAYEAGVKLTHVYVDPSALADPAVRKILERLNQGGVDVLETSPEVFNKMSYGDRREGILAVGEPSVFSLKDLKFKKNPLLVVVEAVEKPGNLGAILRTCDAASVDGLILCDPRTDVYNPNVIRASLGAVFSVPVALGSRQDVRNFLKEKRILICAAAPQAKKLYTAINFRAPTAIVLGNEDKGLSDFWRQAADEQINIPMMGKVDSLNVSVTTAIIVYEALRQRSTAVR